MKKIKYGLSLLMLCLLLMGCQKMPEEVRQRMETYQENEQKAEEAVRYCSVDELRKSSPDQISPKPENLELPEKIDFSGIEGISFLTLQFDRLDREDKETYARIFEFSDTAWETSDDAAGAGWVLQADDRNAKKYMALKENGFVSFLGNDTYETVIVKGDTGRIVETVNVLEEAETVSKMRNGDKLAGELASEAEAWLSRSLPRRDGMTYRVSDLCVREMEEGSRSVSVLAELLYQGIAVSSYGGVLKSRNGSVDVKQIDYGVNLSMNEAGEVTFFSNSIGALQRKEAEKIDSVVDLNSAVQLVSRTLSGFQSVRIDQIRVLYALYPQGAEAEGAAYHAPGSLVLGRPVYAFLVKYGEDDSELGIHKGNAYCHIYVDMVSAEIDTDLEEKGYRR